MDSSTAEATLSPWSRLADLLPYDLTDLIIQALEPTDFISFGGVCVQWRSLHKEYRQRFSPLPPRLRTPTPWIVSVWGFQDQQFLSCISPPPLAEIIIPHTIKNPHQEDCMKCLVGPYGSSCGWLLAEEYHGEKDNNVLCLLNPLTGKIIKLPRFHRHIDFLPVISPPPYYTVFCLGPRQDKMYFFHHSYSDWKVLPLAQDLDQKVMGAYATATTPSLDGGTLYFLSRENCDLHIVNAYPTPSIRLVEMDKTHLPEISLCMDGVGTPFLVESNGDILLAIKVEVDKFIVLQADFSKNAWIKLDTLGDRFLIIDEYNRLCLSATDLGGFERNCIYLSCRGKFQIFDMSAGTRVTTDEKISGMHRKRFIILPSIV